MNNTPSKEDIKKLNEYVEMYAKSQDDFTEQEVRDLLEYIFGDMDLEEYDTKKK